MFSIRRPGNVLAAGLILLASAAAHAALPTRPQVDITGYVIHADLDPATGRLSATAAVTFTTLTDITTATFGLNNALQVTSLTDAANAPLTSERNAADSTIRVALATPLPKGATTTWNFTYAGSPTADTSPVEGIKFVQVADPISVLLYPGRWFPMTGL